MQEYQRKFIELSLNKGVLKFGSFTLKSGRVSPYFFNAGLFNTGDDLLTLGRCYAHAIMDYELDFDMMFGPAYKGIPLVSAAAIALALDHHKNLPWCYNRKEAKDHGEGGNLVGAKLQGNVLVLDDVITAGTAIRESYDLINANNAVFKMAITALNRKEKGKGALSAIDEVKQSLGIDVHSIVNFDDLLSYIEQDAKLKAHVDDMLAYRERYGV